MTTHSDDYCGGYNVWIEIEVNGKKCTTKEIPEFDRGNTLVWYGKYLSSCRDFEFGEDLELINFKVKSNSNNKYCPRFLYAFMEGGITFKSDEMAHEFGDWYSKSKTNYRNHIARRTGGTFELPKSGKSFRVKFKSCFISIRQRLLFTNFPTIFWSQLI